MIGLSRFPEIVRYSRSETGKTRLLMGFGTVTIVCLAIVLIFKVNSGSGEGLFSLMVSMQALILLVFATQRVSISIAKERAERTWDFQRLTPLTSFEITMGKVLGAPLFAYFLFSAILPWVGVAFFIDETAGIRDLYLLYGFIASTFVLVLGLGMMASAFTEGPNSASAGGGGAIIGFIGFIMLMPALQGLRENTGGSLSFYTVSIQPEYFRMFSALIFGAWALTCAQWRVGLDLLERKRLWRFPAFLLFLSWYLLGILPEARDGARNDPSMLVALAVPILFVYIAAFINSSGIDHWRRWRYTEGAGGWLDHVPVWVAGLVSIGLIALLMALVSPFSGIHDRYLVLFPAFLGRDLFFLQWCRLTKTRRPETMAVAFLTLAYFVPPLFLAGLQLLDHSYLFFPMNVEGIGMAQNVLPALSQMAIMGWILYRKLGQMIH